MRAAFLCAALALVACSSEEKKPAAALADAGATPQSYDFSEARALLFDAPNVVTDGIVVMIDGKIAWEEYAHGYTATNRHITYSVSKSIGSALVGIAVADGLMSLDDSVCKHVTPPAGADATLCDTTIRNLLHMSSGLAWVEDYGDNPESSNVLPMLYGNWSDMGAYAATRPRTKPAGTTFFYSSGDSNLLARALRGALGGNDMRAWAREKLFAPAGLDSAVFEVDRSGTLVFSSSCFMTPRDMARFGLLFMQGGTIDGKRVLTEDWVKFSQAPAPNLATPTPRAAGDLAGDTGGSYGANFWLNAAAANAPPDTLRYPDAPADTYSADGHWGQRIVIVPSRKLVIARVGNDRAAPFNQGPLVGKILAAMDKAGAR